MRDDSIYGRELEGFGHNYNFTIDDTDLYNMEPGNYKMMVQFPGRNNQFDLYYYKNSSRGIPIEKITTIYRDILDIDVRGNVPYAQYGTNATRSVYNTVKYLATNPQIDDIFYEHDLIIEEPRMVLTNAYTKENGDLYISGNTNLAKGDRLRAIIDEDLYYNKYYESTMSYVTEVTGDDLTKYRTFELSFPAKIAPQLVSLS